MKIPKIYFDTSVFNFVIADDVPKEREIHKIQERLYEEQKKLTDKEKLASAPALKSIARLNLLWYYNSFVLPLLSR